jgi:hypothetical protein
MRIERVALEHHGHPSIPGALAADVLAIEQDPPGAGLMYRYDDLGRCRKDATLKKSPLSQGDIPFHLPKLQFLSSESLNESGKKNHFGGL